MSDQERIRQVLINLLSNAIKFSFKNQDIYVRTKYIKTNNNEEFIKFIIIDKGPGINLQQQ